MEFALSHRPLIVVQDRDWESLPEEAREQVRRLQPRRTGADHETLGRNLAGHDVLLHAMS